MGYCIELIDSSFKMKKENFDNAFRDLKSLFVVENMTVCDTVNGKEYYHFRWVDNEEVIESINMYELMESIRFPVEFNGNGDICDIDFYGEKLGDDEIFLSALAPYVEDGSYIEFEGEDGYSWRWCFKNGKLVEETIKNSDIQ